MDTRRELIAAGPPDEWSGAVADALGKKGRARLRRAWARLSARERSVLRRKWKAHMHAEVPRRFDVRITPSVEPCVRQVLSDVFLSLLHVNGIAAYQIGGGTNCAGDASDFAIGIGRPRHGRR